jgi:hypothetical protein
MHGEAHAVDGVDDPLLGDEVDLELVDLEQRLVHQPVSLIRGSR